MKKTLALLLALLWLGVCALAEVPQLSGELFDAAKLAAHRLAAGEYEQLASELPYDGPAPTADDWARFAAGCGALPGAAECQSQYAVAYLKDGTWCVAVPFLVPDDGGVPALILTSADGGRFNGARSATWSVVQSEYGSCDYLFWDQEYPSGSAMLMADGT